MINFRSLLNELKCLPAIVPSSNSMKKIFLAILRIFLSVLFLTSKVTLVFHVPFPHSKCQIFLDNTKPVAKCLQHARDKYCRFCNGMRTIYFPKILIDFRILVTLLLPKLLCVHTPIVSWKTFIVRYTNLSVTHFSVLSSFIVQLRKYGFRCCPILLAAIKYKSKCIYDLTYFS